MPLVPLVPLARAALPAALAACLLLPPWASATPSSGPVVGTREGRVQGTETDGIAVFRGLPYAAPPVGRLRWRPPQPPARWPGVRDASASGPACIQKRGPSLEGGGDPGPTSEDCLTLNIFTPQADRDAKRPVMVWIHGGAFVLGAGSLPIYDGRALARQGVVVVALNYRLGPLGFLVHPALEAEAHGHGAAPANFGLMDQVAALRWVRDHIAAFGGDPHRVTIFGESAGGQSVLALMASPAARGLFQRAIAQSPYGIPSHSRDQARGVGVKLAASLGLPHATASQLRALPAERFADLPDPKLTLAPGLVVGDAVAPRAIVAAFRAGDEARVPLVIGSNSDEATVAAAFGLTGDALVRQLGAGKLLLQPHYFEVRDDDAELGRQVVRDAVFTAFARRIASLHAPRAPTWRYYFSRLPEAAAPGTKGVPHGGEVPVVFGTAGTCGCVAVPPTEADRAASARTLARWTRFARDGEPGPDWPRDNRLGGRVLEIGDDDTVREDFMSRRMSLFINAGNVLESVLR